MAKGIFIVEEKKVFLKKKKKKKLCQVLLISSFLKCIIVLFVTQGVVYSLRSFGFLNQ